MGVIRHSDGTEETVAVKKLKSLAMNNPDSVDLQRECAIMKVGLPYNLVQFSSVAIFIYLEFFVLMTEPESSKHR